MNERYFDNREGREKPTPDCGRLGLVWDGKAQRCARPGLLDLIFPNRKRAAHLGFLDNSWIYGTTYDPDNSIGPFGQVYDQDYSMAPFGGSYDQDASGDYLNAPMWFDSSSQLAGDGYETTGDDGSYYYEDPYGGWYYEDPSGAYYGGDPEGFAYGSYDGSDYWETDANGNYYWEAANGESYYEDVYGNWSWNNSAGQVCTGDAAGNYYCDSAYAPQATQTRQVAQQVRQAVTGVRPQIQSTQAPRQVTQPSITPQASRNQLGNQSGDLLSNPWLLAGAAVLILFAAKN